MSRMTYEEAKKLWIKLQPVKNIIEKITDIAIHEVRWDLRRTSKYWAEKVEIDEIDFDSKKEWKRFTELKMLEKCWNIKNLVLQPKFLLQESFAYNWKTEKRISYIADFGYNKDWKKIIEDVKWMKTEVYKIKRKLFLKKYWHIYLFIES